MTRDNATSRVLARAGCLGGVSTSAISVTRAAGTGRQPAPAWSLAAALLGFFVVTLDAVIVNVALPDIRRDLAGGMSGLQWVADGYTLMFAALLLSAGSLSDRAGARRAFGAGLVVFVAASAGGPGIRGRAEAKWSTGGARKDLLGRRRGERR